MLDKKAPKIQERYTEADFDLLGFHDCYIFGVEWDHKTFSISIQLDYIVAWVKPKEPEGDYQFWVSRATLRFVNIDEPKINLQWRNSAPICQIRELRQQEVRATPNGQKQFHWVLDLSTPDGEISVWATGFELKLLTPPILLDTQSVDLDAV